MWRVKNPEIRESLPVLVLGLLLLASSCGRESGSGGAGEPAGKSAPSAPPATPPVPGALVLTGVLEEIPGEFPPNELYDYAYVMKYRVGEVLQGEWAHPDILVAHYNPRFVRAAIDDAQAGRVGGNLRKFGRGDTHYLVLDSLNKVWSGAVEDAAYYKDPRPRWWALWADRLP